MSRTYRKKEISYSSPRNVQEKRQKDHLRAEIDEELKKIRSPLYAWEVERKKNAL